MTRHPKLYMGAYGHRDLPPSSPYTIHSPKEFKYIRIIVANGEYVDVTLIDEGETSPERQFFMLFNEWNKYRRGLKADSFLRIRDGGYMELLPTDILEHITKAQLDELRDKVILKNKQHSLRDQVLSAARGYGRTFNPFLDQSEDKKQKFTIDTLRQETKEYITKWKTIF